MQTLKYDVPDCDVLLRYTWKNIHLQQFSELIEFEGIKCFKLGTTRDRKFSFHFMNSDCIGIGIKRVWSEVSGKEIPLLSKHTCNPCILLFLSDIKVDTKHLKQLVFYVLLDVGCSTSRQLQEKNDSPFYSYQLMDTSFTEELWSARINGQYTDYQFVVQSQTFLAHRSILAARCPLLAEQFKVKPFENQMEIFNISSDQFHQFLFFIYTGKLSKMECCQEFMKMANLFQMDSLNIKCSQHDHSNQEWELTKLLMVHSKSITSDMFFCKDKKGEVRLDRICRLEPLKIPIPPLTAGLSHSFVKCDVGHLFSFNFSLLKKQNITKIIVASQCLTEAVKDIEYSFDEENMRNENFPNPPQTELTSVENRNVCNINFHVKFESAIMNFQPVLMDSLLPTQLWTFRGPDGYSDVEFQVSDQIFRAHRWMLAARSPVFAAMLAGELSTSSKILIEKVDASTFKNFLHFIYCGILINPVASQDLLYLADQYQVETLKLICEAAPLRAQ